MTPPIRIISNPASGRGRSRQAARKMASLLGREGIPVELHETRGPGDAALQAAQCPEGLWLLIVGGDGTVNEGINGALEAHREVPPLAFLPVGTGNVLAKELKLPRRAAELVRRLRNGKLKRLDVGYSPGRSFVLMAGAGFDAAIVHAFHRHRRGKNYQLAYALCGLWLALRYRLPKIRVDIDGRTACAEAGFVQLSNTRSYGGPLCFSRRACPDDGLLDVLWFKGRRTRDLVRLFWCASTLNPFQNWTHGMYCARGTKVSLSSQQQVPLQIDGDPAGFLPVTYEIRPGAVQVAV